MQAREEGDVPPVLESESDIKACFMGCFDINKRSRAISQAAVAAEFPLHEWQYVLVLKNGIPPENSEPGKDRKSIDLRKALHIFNDCFGGEEVVLNGKSEQEARFEIEKQAFIAAFSSLPEVVRKRDAPKVGTRHALATRRRQIAAELLRSRYVEGSGEKQTERAHTSEQLLELFFSKEEQSAQRIHVGKKLLSGTPFPFQMEEATASDGFTYNRNRNFLELMQRVIVTKLVVHCQLDVRVLTPEEHGGDKGHIYILIRADDGDIRREAARGNFEHELDPSSADPLALEPSSEDYIPLHEAYLDLFERRPSLLDREVLVLLRQTGARLGEVPAATLRKNPALNSLLEWFNETGFRMIDDVEGEADGKLSSSRNPSCPSSPAPAVEGGPAGDTEAPPPQQTQQTMPPGAHAMFVARVETLLMDAKEKFKRGGSDEEARRVAEMLVREVTHAPDSWVQAYVRRRLVPPMKTGKGVSGNLQKKVDGRMIRVLPAFKDFLRLRMSSPTLDATSLMQIANANRKRGSKLKSLWNLLHHETPPPMYTRFSPEPSLELLWKRHTVRRPAETGGDFQSIGIPSSVLKTLHSLISRQVRCHHLISEGVAAAFFPLDSLHKFDDPRLLSAASFDGRLQQIEARHRRSLLEWKKGAAASMKKSSESGLPLMSLPVKPEAPTAEGIMKEWEKLSEKQACSRNCVLTRIWAVILSFKPQIPSDSVRTYFGEKVGFYFALLAFITLAMIPAAVVGIPAFIIQQVVRDRDDHVRMGSDALFGFLMVLWMAVLVYGWENRQWVLRERWGMQRLKEQRGGAKIRPGFRGDSKRSPVDESETDVFFPTWIQAIRVTVGIAVVAVCVAASAAISLEIARIRSDWVREVESAERAHEEYLAAPPGTMRYPGDPPGGLKQNAILFWSFVNIVVNAFFSVLVRNIVTTRLAEWANLKTQRAHDQLLFVSTFAVDFVVGFFPFFYTAFLKPSIEGCIQKPADAPYFGGKSRFVEPCVIQEQETGRCERAPSCAEELSIQLGSSYMIKIGLNVLELGLPALMLWLKTRFSGKKKTQDGGKAGGQNEVKTQVVSSGGGAEHIGGMGGGNGTVALPVSGAGFAISTAAPTETGDQTVGPPPFGGAALGPPSSSKDEGGNRGPEGGDVPIGAVATLLLQKGEYTSPAGTLDGLFEDFNEVTVGLCFITLFVVAFPIAPVLGLFFFLLESKVDSVKLFHLVRRPIPVDSDGIGPWMPLLKVLLILTAGMQSALLAYTFHSLDFLFPNATALEEGAALNKQPVQRHAAFALCFLIFLLTIWVVASSMSAFRKYAMHGVARMRVQSMVARLQGEDVRSRKEGMAATAAPVHFGVLTSLCGPFSGAGSSSAAAAAAQTTTGTQGGGMGGQQAGGVSSRSVVTARSFLGLTSRAVDEMRRRVTRIDPGAQAQPVAAAGGEGGLGV
uniref:Anoctamin transmembrane domain-containing protein n=1 Tax=Chromera velia CCMP2878 TaxID=1169474 RepID=A0A0G4I4Q3_9ALVE|eukprot:Cvel_10968.t1-p1 / transcript=Cvel_10968.t1 / gene=Cvel_10968 / organism=Chromera_velia_CCMP2878 / gene_product=Anoctamin-9, putative / transcript_product=Anoctamin-9, putative / location=Cvel_scaffold675:5232-12459(-) / protein_length=1432 / sequence_SO=supercontig / SO=protein_coding / is_pseudo=false